MAGEPLLGGNPSLKALRRAVDLWPRDWRPALGEDGDWLGAWNCVSRRDGDADEVSADANEDYAADLAKFVAALVNAAPALIEIAEAALVWRNQRAENLLTALTRTDSEIEAEAQDVGRARVKRTAQLARALEMTLAKVRP